MKRLWLEGKEKGEGMSGISPRFIMNALNIALGSAKDGASCINPVDIIRALKHQFEHHIGFSDEEKDRYISLLLAEKSSVLAEYRERAKKEINRAFLYAYEDQAQALFDNYIKNATAYCLKRKLVDPVTQEEQEPDERLMRAIEEMIGISEGAKRRVPPGAVRLQVGRPRPQRELRLPLLPAAAGGDREEADRRSEEHRLPDPGRQDPPRPEDRWSARARR